MPKQFVTFCRVDELANGQREVFDLDTMSILLFNIDDQYYAVENLCSHEEYELADGELADGCIECPKHGATFDIHTGEARSAPAYTPVKVFPTRVDGTDVQVELELED